MKKKNLFALYTSTKIWTFEIFFVLCTHLVSDFLGVFYFWLIIDKLLSHILTTTFLLCEFLAMFSNFTNFNWFFAYYFGVSIRHLCTHLLLMFVNNSLLFGLPEWQFLLRLEKFKVNYEHATRSSSLIFKQIDVFYQNLFYKKKSQILVYL